jgi:carboxyvinyl-carboxyphosphonate phosphorylmutase
LAGPGPVLAPGAYDALSARLIEQAGFEAVYMTGFGAAASLLGRPDIGLLSFSEMVDNARRIAAVVDVPVIADADNGYGNAINVIRTVREYEAAGVAAIQLEDQVVPKRCGHMEGKHVIAADEMVGKLRAAVDARRSKDCLIIARTDARAVEGLDRALDRACRYREAGADVLFVEAPQSEQEVALIGKTLGAEVPLLYNWVEGGKSPPLSRERLGELGFRLIIFPVTALFAATRIVRESLTELRKSGTPVAVVDRPVRFPEFLDVIGVLELSELEKRFA